MTTVQVIDTLNLIVGGYALCLATEADTRGWRLIFLIIALLNIGVALI